MTYSEAFFMLSFKLKGRNSKPAGAALILLPLGFGALLMILCSLISSAIVFSFEDPGALIGIASLCTVIISAGLCGAITSFLTEGALKNSLIVAGALSTILFILPIAFGGNFGGGVMNALCYFGICILATPIFKKKRRKRR